MRRIFNKSLLLAIILLCIYSCGKAPRVNMDNMLDIVDANPDSVLSTLKDATTDNLDDVEFAKFIN